MPKVQDILLRLEGFPSGTILDLKNGILPHELTFKQELDQLEYLKVKKKVNRSQ